MKIEQLSIQGDHIHVLIRAPKRSQFQHFFRVVAGQIAQRLENDGFLKKRVTDTLAAPPRSRKRGTGLWWHRPFTRVVKGWKAYKIAKDYIQLNEKEVKGEIKYQKRRLKGLSSGDWEELWRRPSARPFGTLRSGLELSKL